MTNSIGKNDDQKLEELKKMIGVFVHVYKGSIMKEKLPGLRDFVVVLKVETQLPAGNPVTSRKPSLISSPTLRRKFHWDQGQVILYIGSEHPDKERQLSINKLSEAALTKRLQTTLKLRLRP